MALSATQAATLLDGYTAARVTLLMGTTAAPKTDGTSLLDALATTRTNIINDIVASAQLPAKNATQAAAMLDTYAAAYISQQTTTVGITAAGTNLSTAIASQRTSILNYLTH